MYKSIQKLEIQKTYTSLNKQSTPTAFQRSHESGTWLSSVQGFIERGTKDCLSLLKPTPPRQGNLIWMMTGESWHSEGGGDMRVRVCVSVWLMVLSKDAACQGAWTGCPNHVLLPGTSHHSVWAEIEVSAGPWSRQLVPGHAMSVWGQTYTNTHTHTQTQTENTPSHTDT